MTWNPDGTAAPLKREFTYQGKRYKLTLAPAYIERADGTLRAEFPGVKEEVLELVLTKLAMDKGYFTDSGDGHASSDSFVLFTSIHQIAEELKRRGAAREKSKSYSYPQIREALQVLAKSKIHLRCEGEDDDLIFSPIADLGHFTDKASRDAAKATVYIRFNALISQAILARTWRQINYDRIMRADLYLVRWLRKILGLRFTYAAPNKTYNIKLSTIIENSGVTLRDRLSDNLKAIEQALRAMPDVIDRFTIEKDFGVHSGTGKGRVLIDAKIIIRPTHAFTIEQMKTNVHENRLDTAVAAEDGSIVVEPRREEHPSLLDYERAKDAFQAGRPIKPR